MTSISKNVCIDILNDIVNEYNNTYHRKIKMKPVDVKDNAYIDNKLIITAENFAARLAQANLATESDIANFVNKTDFDEKLKNVNKKVTSTKQNI